jgi:diaminohydroxyphosphoribosylaminopyrimidine deaminase/5-amino-6-(5-phosphoribosylamino)uracil reductase
MQVSSHESAAQTELRWMHYALSLAEKGIGLASPNPTVGCVLVDEQDQAVGEGFHQYAERDHAEVVALRTAGERARNSTAYVTLEPCTHQGRTGPCADALIAAGVARVIIATIDANPVVRGNGVERLRAAGIPVVVGVAQQEARRLNDAFARYIRTRLPYITLKAALSLDGRIAPSAYEREARAPVWLTGESARIEVHRMRHAHDALLTGVGTVLADDPLLTDRSGLPRRLPLLRVVLDTHLRIPVASKLVEASSEGDLVLFSSMMERGKVNELSSRGIRVERLASGPAGLPLEQVFASLGEMGVTSVIVEAGTRLNTTLLARGLVDRLVLFYAPVLLGAEGLPLIDSSRGMARLPSPETSRFGDDLCLTSTLQSYWDE